MQALRFLFSPSGRLRPQAFILAAIAVYLGGAASQWFTTSEVIARGGLWLFAAAQAVLTWVWFALHAKRLRDAGQPAGLAAGAAVLYALSVVLLLFLAFAFFAASAGSTTDVGAQSALGLILLVTIIATLAASSNYDSGWFMVALLTAITFMPLIVAVAVTAFAATRPSVPNKIE